MEESKIIDTLETYQSTNIVVFEGLVVLKEDSLGDVVVQSHHEVELHPNGVVHAGSLQDFLHLVELLVDGLGSLDDVLQLTVKICRVSGRQKLSPHSYLRRANSC